MTLFFLTPFGVVLLEVPLKLLFALSSGERFRAGAGWNSIGRQAQTDRRSQDRTISCIALSAPFVVTFLVETLATH